jgi:hypothetical protein
MRRTLFALATCALVLYVALSLGAIAHLFTGHPTREELARLIGLGANDETPPPPSSTGMLFRDLAHEDDRFYFAPYSYLQKRTAGTPEQTRMNELGFRCEELPGYRARHPDARVIVVLGGSAAFSHSVPRDADTWPKLLERKLNKALGPAPGREFQVVNLGMPSAHVLNEIVYFVLFGWALKPEIVIAHDGFNDLLDGQITSCPLVEKYQLTYYKLMYEDWARLLSARGAAVAAMTPMEAQPPVQPACNAAANVDAYWARELQLAEIAGAAGAKFVAGLQPMSESKQGLSAVEQQRIARSNLYYQHCYARMKELYGLYASRHDPAKVLPHFVDLHAAFAKQDARATLFVDFMHCNEAGDALIADAYLEVLTRMLTPETH